MHMQTNIITQWRRFDFEMVGMGRSIYKYILSFDRNYC